MIELSFNGTDDKVVQWIAEASSELVAVLRTEMLKEMIRMRDVVVENKLSGQVLKNKTGTLRRSQHASVNSTETEIIGKVATDPAASAYGRVHEYGGTFNVRAHLRKGSHSVGTWVREHSAHYPERSFLRSTLTEMAPEITEALQNAINTYVAEKNAK